MLHKRKSAMNFNEIARRVFSPDREVFLQELVDDPSFRERILVSSLSLYQEIEKVRLSNKPLNRKIESALVKYVLRMAGRSQPYGLSAGMVIANNKEARQYKRVSVSLEWEHRAAKLIEQKISFESELLLYKSALLVEEESQFYLDKHKDKKDFRLYIPKNTYIDGLFKVTKKHKSVIEILSEYQTEDQLGVLRDIKKLLEQDVLVSELRSPSVGRNKFSFFSIMKSKKIIEDVDVIVRIESFVEKYKKAPIGEGIQLYKDAIDKMQSLASSPSYLVVDLYHVEREKVSLKEASFLENKLDVMKVFSGRLRCDWEKYKLRFMEKYGILNEVNLVDVIDKDLGIGLPVFSGYQFGEHPSDHYLLSKIVHNGRNNENEVQLDDQDIERLLFLNKQNQKNQKKEMSYDCKLVPTKNQFIIPPNAFSFPMGSFVGRFPEEFYQMEFRKGWAELNYVGNRGKDLGVANCSGAELCIDMVGSGVKNKEAVDVKQIKIGMTEKDLYLTYDSEIIFPSATQLFAYSNFNEHPLVLFLFEYSLYYASCPSNIVVEVFNFLEFIPRVVYKDLIISPARLNLRVNDDYKQDEKIEYIKKKINEYRFSDYTYVYVLEGDRTLPLKIGHEFSYELMYKSSRKSGEEYILTLMEAPELEDLEGCYYDYIYSVQDNMDEKEKEVSEGNNLPAISSKELADFSWSSYYVYYRKGKRQKVLYDLVSFLESKGAKKVFAVHYRTGGEHIRIRYKQDREINVLFEDYLEGLLKKGESYNFEKQIFYPEIARYGGVELYELVYEFFSLDTQSMVFFDKYLKSLDDESKGLFMCSYMLFEFFFKDIDRLFIYGSEAIKKDGEYVKLFSKRRKYYCDVVLSAYSFAHSGSDSILKRRKMGAEKVYNRARLLGKDRFYYLLDSIMHMTMNRYFPYKRDLEYQLRQFLRFALVNVEYTLKGRVKDEKEKVRN